MTGRITQAALPLADTQPAAGVAASVRSPRCYRSHAMKMLTRGVMFAQ